MFNKHNTDREFSKISLINSQQTICDSFIFNENPNLGQIFGIIELQSKDKSESFKFLSFVLNELEDIFYSHEPADDKCLLSEQHFELILKQLNNKVSTLIQTGQISLLNKNFNIAICLLSPNANLKERSVDLYISQIGRPLAFLLHQSNDKYGFIDIFSGQETAKINPVKFFSNIISGKIFFNDKLFITTKNIFNYFSSDKIKTNLINLNSRQFSDKISSVLEQTNTKNNFSAVTIGINEPEEIKQKDINFESQTSINKLINTEDETEKILAGNSKKPLSSLKKSITNKKTESSKSYSLGTLSRNKSNIIIILKKIGSFFSYILLFFKNIFIFILNFFTVIGKFITNKNNYRSEFFSKTKTSFKKVPKLSKILLAFGLIFIIVFIQSLIWIKDKQEIKREQQAFDNSIVQIENKLDEAQASLIYKNESKALTIVNDAQEFINQLAINNDDRQQQKNDLQQQINDLINKINHVTVIENPKKLISLDQGVSVEKLLLNQDQLYAFKSSNEKIYSYELTNSKLTKYDSADNDSIITAVFYNDNLIFLHEDNKLSEYNFEDKSSNALNLTVDSGELVDIKIYNDHLYGLNPAENQIFKFSKKTASGFGTGVTWIKDNVNIGNAVSMVIDGSIYTLETTGKISKFLTGNLQSFMLEKINPAYVRAKKMYTNLDYNKIIILEPENKRFNVYDKNGKLLSQYFSEKFDKLTDFAINERKNVVYLLNGSVIYEVEI